MPSEESYLNERLDHLGIVAGVCPALRENLQSLVLKLRNLGPSSSFPHPKYNQGTSAALYMHGKQISSRKS